MASVLAAPTLDDLRHFLEHGLSIVAATRDAQMRSALGRCGGARLGDDGLVRVLVAMPEGTQTLANIQATKMIALCCVRPLTYRTLQVKGTDAHRIEWPEGESVARAHRPAFQAEIERLGLPASISGLLWSQSFVPIAFTPGEIFDQTPGPSAGLSFIA